MVVGFHYLILGSTFYLLRALYQGLKIANILIRYVGAFAVDFESNCGVEGFSPLLQRP